LVTFKTKLDLL